MPNSTSLQTEVGVFAPQQLEELSAFFAAHGFAVLRGLWDGAQLAAVEAQCTAAQRSVVAGELAERHGNTILVDDEGPARTRFANYVQYVTQIAPAVGAAVLDPVIVELMGRWVPGGHLEEASRFGVVYQDARPGRQSGYTRIGWHTTAPFRNANGVAVPEGAKATGGHADEPPPFEMPLGFEKIHGEMAVFCERGDVIFHDAYLWHSAARATDDDGIRRHIRGGWFSGRPEEGVGDGLADFVKNAAR